MIEKGGIFRRYESHAYRKTLIRHPSERIEELRCGNCGHVLDFDRPDITINGERVPLSFITVR